MAVSLAAEAKESAQPPTAALPAAQAHMHKVCSRGPAGLLWRNRRGELPCHLVTGPVGRCDGQATGGPRVCLLPSHRKSLHSLSRLVGSLPCGVLLASVLACLVAAARLPDLLGSLWLPAGFATVALTSVAASTNSNRSASTHAGKKPQRLVRRTAFAWAACQGFTSVSGGAHAPLHKAQAPKSQSASSASQRTPGDLMQAQQTQSHREGPGCVSSRRN